MKKYLYLLCMGIAASACQQKNEFTLSASLPEPYSGKVYLTYIQPENGLTKLDSLSIEQSTSFQFKGVIEHPEQYRIITSPNQYSADFIAEPQSEYSISFGNEPDATQITVLKGGSQQQLLNEYTQAMQSFKDTEETLNEAMGKLAANNGNADSVMQLMSKNFMAREEATKQFIHQHPQSFVACVLAGDLLLYTYPDLRDIKNVIDTVSYSYSNAYQCFNKKCMEAQSKWIQDLPAPDFTTRDLNGKEIHLRDFRGKYVLLDFWASWCKPCRKRAAELKAIYDQLQARGIVVCGISMDEKKAQWVNATREDGIIWTNTGELKPFKDNTIAADYKVTQLPTMFLVSPEGIILMQDPEIDDLLKLPIK